MKLLVVDDDSSVLDAMRDILEDEGYEVSLAANGREALVQLRAGRRPCLILLDLMMPVMNGWEFRQAQLADDALAAIPTVVLTADGRAVEKAADLQASGFLQKPIEPGRLLRTIESHCGPKSSN